MQQQELYRMHGYIYMYNNQEIERVNTEGTM